MVSKGRLLLHVCSQGYVLSEPIDSNEIDYVCIVKQGLFCQLQSVEIHIKLVNIFLLYIRVDMRIL